MRGRVNIQFQKFKKKNIGGSRNSKKEKLEYDENKPILWYMYLYFRLAMYVLRKAIYKLLKVNNLLMDNEQFVLKMSNIGVCDVVQWQKLRSMEN